MCISAETRDMLVACATFMPCHKSLTKAINKARNEEFGTDAKSREGIEVPIHLTRTVVDSFGGGGELFFLDEWC